MSNDKLDATFHPDEEKARIAEARGRRMEPLGIDPVPGDTRPLCRAKLNVKGSPFTCDYVADHDGWAHSNRRAQAIWACG